MEEGIGGSGIISLRFKRKVYKTIVKPAIVYAAETWAVNKSQYVAEMTVLKMDEWSLKKLLRRQEEYVGKRVVVMEVSGKRRRGSTKWKSLDNIRNDFSERGL